MRENPGEFQIRNGNQAVAIVGGDKRVRDVHRETLAPYNGRGGFGAGEPHAAHANLARVTGPHVRRRRRNQLLDASGTCFHGVDEGGEVGHRVIHSLIKANSRGVAFAQGGLQHREEPRVPGNAGDIEQSSPSNWCHRRVARRFRGGCIQVSTLRRRATRCGGRFSVIVCESTSHPSIRF
jgi:hypothetical protein